MAKTSNPSRVTPAAARESIAALPISWNESCRNNSPNPGKGRAIAPEIASKVLSRFEIPVPPVINTACAPAARARCNSSRIRAGSSGTIAAPLKTWPRSASIDLINRPPSSVASVRESEQVITYTRANAGARCLCS